MKIEMWAIERVKPYEQNPRINDDAVAAVARSIQEFGFRQPIVVDKQGVIVVGHTRLRAALSLGMKKVPVHVATDLTPIQVRAYRVADNQTAALAEWNLAVLAAELAGLSAENFDLELLAFGDELAAMMAGPGAEPDAAEPTLSDRFLVPPFSVLNAREGWWQDRKRQWLALGIQSELGRGGGGGGAAPPHGPQVTKNADGTLCYRSPVRQDWHRRVDKAAPGGSPRPACKLGPDGKSRRGNGVGRAIRA